MEDEKRADKLDVFYHQVKKQILQYQSGSIGLFPLHTSGKNEESHVRDNVYCAMAVWALGLAYRHMDDSNGRAYELQQAAVKCMRGILFCYMRQADKVEQFKKNQLGHHSLHVKFNVNTGDTVASDSEWAHLQIDAVSLYVLTLVQMTAAGLQASMYRILARHDSSKHRLPRLGADREFDKKVKSFIEGNWGKTNDMTKAQQIARLNEDCFVEVEKIAANRVKYCKSQRLTTYTFLFLKPSYSDEEVHELLKGIVDKTLIAKLNKEYRKIRELEGKISSMKQAMLTAAVPHNEHSSCKANSAAISQTSFEDDMDDSAVTEMDEGVQVCGAETPAGSQAEITQGVVEGKKRSLKIAFAQPPPKHATQIIYTNDEVNFVQNLVYYIERAYRTPDYGMWEKGSKENVGHKELNSSSIGMAKAALEAINGFNIFGMQGTSSSVIYVDPDAHNRNYTIMHSMLPIASSSKETDASLLMITGFPAFAVGDETLCQQANATVLEKLEGNYGLKRFLRDGYKSVVEDKHRRFYEKRELQIFDKIESEWPFFFIYLALDALFKNDKDTADHYIKKLQDELLQHTDSGDLIPHYYYVPKIYLEAERKDPHTQIRLPSDEDGDLFLWGQSLLIIMQLLDCGLLDVNEIDPIGRHLSHSAKNRYGYSSHRYSSFKVADSDLVVQVSLISESRNLQTTLATFGIETQTPQQIEPIQIWPPSELVKVYKRLGVNRKLGLSGRPPRPIGSLGTSKIYRIVGRTVVTYPKLLDETDFYMALDMSLLIDDIKTNLAFTRNNWNMKGRPTLCLLLREKNLRGKQFHEALELLASFKRGLCGGVKIKLGRLQTLVSTAVIDHLDFIQVYHDVRDPDEFEGGLDQARVREKEGVDSNPLTPGSSEGHKMSHSIRLSRSMTVSEDDDQQPSDEEDANPKDLVTKSREALLVELHSKPNVDRRMLLLQEILKREGEHFQTQEGKVGDIIDQLYQQAAYDKKWSAVRRGAGLLKKLVDSLAPGITTLLVSGKVVTIGVFGHEEKVIYEPLTPAAIQKILYSFCSPHDVREAVLQQEMVLYLASFVAVMPKVFEGMLKIRIGWIIEAMKQRLASRGLGSLYTRSPSDVKALLKIVLTSQGKLHGQDIAPRTPLQNRQLDGAMHRVPPGFYDKVWSILDRAPEGIKVSQHSIFSQLPTISEMTHRERNFQLKVEEMLSDISNPEYRQTVVELLVVLATVLERNPEVELSQCIDLDELVDEAIELFGCDLPPENGQNVRDQFYNTPRDGKGGTTTYMARAVVNKLLRGSASVSSNCYVS